MITPHHILRLLTTGYHEGRYLNGHPEICEWLDNNPEPHSYVVEQLPDELEVLSYNNVRIWSSVEAQQNAKRHREQELSRPEQSSELETFTIEPPHPLVIQLYEAVSLQDLPRIVQLKQECRNNGIKFDRQKTDIRRIGNLPNIDLTTLTKLI